MEELGVSPWDMGRKYDEETHYQAMNYLYDKSMDESPWRSYYGKVTYIDNKVGELVKILEETNQRGNTVIIFTSK